MMISNNSVKRLKKMPRGTFLAFFETHKWMHVCLLVAMVVTIPFMAFFSMSFLFLNVFPTLWSFYYPMATPTNLFLLLNLIIFTLFAMSHSPHSAAAPRSRPAARVLPSAAAIADNGDDDDDNDNPIHPSSPSPSPSPMSSIPYLHLPSSPSSNLMPTPSQSPSALAPSPSALASPAMHSGEQYYPRLFDHQVTDNYLNLMPTPSQSPSAWAPSPSALASPAMQYYRRLFDHRVTDNYLVASPVRHLGFEDADMLLGSTGPLPEASPPSSILASSSHKVMVFSTSTGIHNDDDDGGGGGRRDGFDVDDATNLDKSGAYNSRKSKDLTQIVKKRAGSERQRADQQDEQGGAVTGSDQISGAYYEGYNRESMESSEGRSPVVVENGEEVDDAEEEAEGGEVRHWSLVSHERPLASSHFTHRNSTSSKSGASGLGHSPLRPNNSRGRTNAKRPGQTLEATWRAICEAKKSTHPPGSPLKNNNRRIILHRSTSGSPSTGNSPTSLKAKPREPSMRADELHSRIEAFISRFNDQIRIQREQSILNYMEMVDRSAK